MLTYLRNSPLAPITVPKASKTELAQETILLIMLVSAVQMATKLYMAIDKISRYIKVEK